MFRSNRIILAATMLCAMLAPIPPAGAAGKPEPVAPPLTPRLQKLFTQEMAAVLRASQRIVAALAAGDHAAVAKNAREIHDSFILDKNLTAQDRRDLDAAVPPAFLDLDRTFHRMAARLAEAARDQDLDLQTHYFGRMLETCQTCHSRYATDKFPGFGGKAPATHAH
jgi:hypothetical protein